MAWASPRLSRLAVKRKRRLGFLTTPQSLRHRRSASSDEFFAFTPPKFSSRLQHAVAGWLRLRLRRAPSLPAAWPLRRGDEEEEEVRWRWS
uniref:Uncharacterized protein n=1 Tax=Oryza nivara TaxID=4536 RepID=A0A0E0JBU2_ORYNI